MSFSAVGFAHVDMTSPTPRAHGPIEGNGGALKSGPCGQTANGRTANVNVFSPGETITVTWDEYIDHPAYYRIAFDDDGDDGFLMRSDGQTDPTADDPVAMEDALGMDAEILAIVPEQSDTTAGNEVRSFDVTLPNITCENCTLQLIQYMYNGPQQGYFQCADIALRAGQQAGTADAGLGGSDGAGDAGAAGSANAGTAGNGGAPSGPPSTGGTSSSAGATGGSAAIPSGGAGGGSSTAGTANLPSAGSSPVSIDDEEDDGGCSIATHVGAGSAAPGLVGLLGLALGVIGRRRRTAC